MSQYSSKLLTEIADKIGFLRIRSPLTVGNVAIVSHNKAKFIEALRDVNKVVLSDGFIR